MQENSVIQQISAYPRDDLQQEIAELQEEIDALKVENRDLKKRNLLLCAAEQEKNILLEEVGKRDEAIKAQQFQINKALAARDLALMEKARNEGYKQEVERLKARISTILAICAIPRSQMLPNAKLAWITGPEQVPYSAEKHGGPGDVMITSMKQWNIAIGGDGKNAKNTNCLNDALKALEAGGAVKREPVNTGDGRRHYAVTFDQKLLNNPHKFVHADGETNPHNGGNKRCPVCKEYCKKRVAISYYCVPCGLEFDSSMNVIEQSKQLPPVPMDDTPVQSPEQEPESIKVPRCMHWQCAITSSRVEVRMWGGKPSYYCKSHNGYIDERGLPQ